MKLLDLIFINYWFIVLFHCDFSGFNTVKMGRGERFTPTVLQFPVVMFRKS